MLVFDITLPPPSRQDLDREKCRLSAYKKRRLGLALASDVVHFFAFLLIYYFGPIGALPLFGAYGLATLFAMILAIYRKGSLGFKEPTLVSIGAALVMASIIWIFQDILGAGIPVAVLTGLTAGSMVIAGAIIGCQLLQVQLNLEALKPIADDELAVQELAALCDHYPQLSHYRQEARSILRPNLTQGELQAMRDWLQR